MPEKNKVFTIDADKFMKAANNGFADQVQKELEIKNASIKDMQCSYGYELLTGKTKGDIIGRRGIHIVHEDLIDKFSNLDVFLAHIDEVFKNDATVNNQTLLKDLEEKEELSDYFVSAFKITGVEENKSVILIGTKTVSQGDISFSTPKIKLGGSYLYMEELEQRLEELITEVELYMGGKTAPQLEQVEMEFDSLSGEDNSDFDDAKVN
jgi:hypothetical protein